MTASGAVARGSSLVSATTLELERRLPRDLKWFDLLKPITLLALSIIPLVIIAQIPEAWDEQWAAVVPGLLLVAIVAVMLWPSAGLQKYFAYKRPLFILTIVAELWILVGGAALFFPDTVKDKDVWFQLMLVGFFLLTAIISLPGMAGEYRRGLFFRPDLLYGNGAYLARGEIFVALGLKLLTTEEIAHPIWNWWGLTWALAAMIFLVPFRGILKMRMRRARFLALDNWMGPGLRLGLWVKETFLFVGLFLLVYGFANVYMGKAPFTWTPGDPTGNGGLPEFWGLAFLAGAFFILVPLRGWFKTRLSEPPTLAQEFAKGILVWVAFLLLIYGFFLLFMGEWQDFHGFGYYNFWWGIWISALGFLMIGPLRSVTLRDEFRGTLKIMIPRMADLSEEERRLMMGRRLEVMAAMPDRPRKENMKLMMKIIHKLPDESRHKLVKTRTELVADAPAEQRAVLMRTMAAAFAEMEQPERTGIMAEMMGAVAQLPSDKRRTMMEQMSALMA